MMNLMAFDNNEFGQVRAFQKDGEVWFVGKDVCEAFGDTNYRRSLSRIDNEDKNTSQISTPGGTQNMTVINESGLYSLLFQMQPQKAKGVSQSAQPQKAHHDGVSDEYPIEIQERIDKLHRFKRWVTSEVLPAIRKHGAYLTDKKAYEITHNPNSLADLLIQAGEQLRKKDLVIQEMQPKALFADAVATSKTSILIGDLAKILKQNGVNIGQKRLFEWLRNHGYLVKRNGADRNMPTQKSMDMGLFEIKETVVTHADGHVTISKTTKVTGKGQQYFINKFLANEARE